MSRSYVKKNASGFTERRVAGKDVASNLHWVRLTLTDDERHSLQSLVYAVELKL